jgi:hypothetical protein
MVRRLGSPLVATYEWMRELLEKLWVFDKPEGWDAPKKDPRNGL